VNTRSDNDIARAVSAISIAPDPQECSRIFLDAVAAFGFDAFSCGEADLKAPERTVFYAIAWPDAFRKFYFANRLARRDPLFGALKGYHMPFTWSDLQRDRKMSGMGTRALQVLAAHGWTEGLAVPIPRGGPRVGLVSLAGQRRAPDAEEKLLLAMLAYCFHERLRSLVPRHGFPVPPLGLTRREIDSLRLVAGGATDREAARRMGISPATAHEYVEKAKRKMKVSTRAEAIAVAVSLAIINP
jgi:LuxR family transcriptional regulator, quorum-sensing system regulator BjaR1